MTNAELPWIAADEVLLASASIQPFAQFSANLKPVSFQPTT
jgi:hypothetical protein